MQGFSRTRERGRRWKEEKGQSKISATPDKYNKSAKYECNKIDEQCHIGNVAIEVLELVICKNYEEHK